MTVILSRDFLNPKACRCLLLLSNVQCVNQEQAGLCQHTGFQTETSDGPICIFSLELGMRRLITLCYRCPENLEVFLGGLVPWSEPSLRWGGRLKVKQG